MTDLYHGYPIFLWQALFNLSSIVFAGLLIAFVTTFYLKRKDESIRVAGVILEILMVNSIYKLDLSRPKKSFLAQRRENKEAEKVERFLLKKSLMGQFLPKIVVLSISLLEAKKGVEIGEQQAVDYFGLYSAGG